jgi:hypothetical protein
LVWRHGGLLGHAECKLFGPPRNSPGVAFMTSLRSNSPITAFTKFPAQQTQLTMDFTGFQVSCVLTFHWLTITNDVVTTSVVAPIRRRSVDQPHAVSVGFFLRVFRLRWVRRVRQRRKRLRRRCWWLWRLQRRSWWQRRWLQCRWLQCRRFQLAGVWWGSCGDNDAVHTEARTSALVVCDVSLASALLSLFVISAIVHVFCWLQRFGVGVGVRVLWVCLCACVCMFGFFARGNMFWLPVCDVSTLTFLEPCSAVHVLLQTMGAQALLPVTLAQLSKAMASASDGEVVISGLSLKHTHVRLVGRIVGIEDRTTQVAFTLQDGTQEILVTLWKDVDVTDFMQARMAGWGYVSTWFCWLLPAPRNCRERSSSSAGCWLLPVRAFISH